MHQVCGEMEPWKHRLFNVCIEQWIIIIKMSVLSATQETWLKTEPELGVTDRREDKRVQKREIKSVNRRIRYSVVIK